MSLFLFPGAAIAEEPVADTQNSPHDLFTVATSLWAHHWTGGGKVNDQLNLVSLEWAPRGKKILLGATYFKNSFNKDSAHFYVGRRWFWWTEKTQNNAFVHGIYFKVMAGPMIGYSGEHKGNVPLNYKGLGWALIPAVGYQFKRANLQLGAFGKNGAFITMGYALLR